MASKVLRKKKLFLYENMKWITMNKKNYDKYEKSIILKLTLFKVLHF